MVVDRRSARSSPSDWPAGADIHRGPRGDRTRWRSCAESFDDQWIAGEPARLYLEPWVPAAHSCVWDFTALVRRAPALVATPTVASPASPSLPASARSAADRDLLDRMFTRWDVLAARGELPTELPVLGLGVDGGQVTAFLDELLTRARHHRRDYYERVCYLLCDSSEQRVDIARVTAIEHASRIRSVIVDPARPGRELSFVRGKLFLAVVSGVYPGLPSDDIVRVDGQTYRSQVRAYLPGRAGRALAGSTGIPISVLPRAIARLAQSDPQQLADMMPVQFPRVEAAVAFGKGVWSSVGLEERHVPVDLDAYGAAHGVSVRVLRSLLAAADDERVPVSIGATASFLDTLGLLHPAGLLHYRDVFTPGMTTGNTEFAGHGAGLGAIAGRVNTALLQAVAGEHGREVVLERVPRQMGIEIVTLSAFRAYPSG